MEINKKVRFHLVVFRVYFGTLIMDRVNLVSEKVRIGDNWGKWKLDRRQSRSLNLIAVKRKEVETVLYNFIALV